MKVHQPTREQMKQNVAAYIKYYNLDRLQTASRDMSPIDLEISQINLSVLGWTSTCLTGPTYQSQIIHKLIIPYLFLELKNQ